MLYNSFAIMYLQELRLLHFKNWEEAQFSFSPKLNAFTGPNGSGKTNVLDAIHYLSMCKSYFAGSDVGNIKDNEPFLVIEGDFMKNEASSHIYCGLKRGQKKVFKKNKKEYDKLTEHIGQFPTVVISPYDRDLITDSAELRRRFMDAVISQGDHHYLHHLVRYNKAVSQRNALLKYFAQNRTFDSDSLAMYDEQLDEHGTPVFEKRKFFTERLTPKLQDYYQQIAGHESPGLSYQSALSDKPIRTLLEENLPKDRLNQYTGVGVHRDDLSFKLNGRPVKRYGSQGQQKSFLIALKLAQYDFLKEEQETKPVLLLDDIFDKLDEERVEHLVRLVSSENFGQIFLTDTHPERTEPLVKKIHSEAKIFNTAQYEER